MDQSVSLDVHILIIDEQSLAQSYLKFALEKLGYQQISVADRAQDAIQLCKKRQFDLIICAHNLQTGKDGFQLYEELKSRGLQKLSTGFIFISADTDPSLVYSVIELQPDEFLAKPFVIGDLELRIERVLKRKHQLKPIYQLLDGGQPERALELINTQLSQAENNAIYPLLLKVKGDLLLQLGRIKNAEAFFDAMLDIQPFPWARIGLARTLLAQDKQSQALMLLQQLIKRPETRLEALDCMAEIEFRQQQFDEAQQHLQQAASLAPRNLLRQQRLLQLSRINHDYEAQYNAAKSMVKFSRHSRHEQPDLYLNLARASIDLALTLDQDDEQSMRLAKQVNQCLTTIRQQFNDHRKEFQQEVIQARVLYLKVNKDKAQQLLKDLQQTPPDDDSIEDALDRAKALHEVGLTEASNRLFRQISQRCQRESDDPIFSVYLEQEQKERASMPYGARELNNNAVHLFQHGNWQEAFKAFELALRVMPKSAAIALNLLQTILSAPRRHAINESQQETLILRCLDIIEQGKLNSDQLKRYQKLKERHPERFTTDAIQVQS
ncbi:response regulator [Alkalimonas collagenimarina]|uniref:Response regulator n=1 Tax=Alkalimonas collagenimarina TaxID=400390 RepID=A0ABT9GUN2_9GAMM|nr:tetratricopeptide repeat-containing response regulator [Alkalimonas collagenimarina]MDP4534683.1 response regulator [Alkalimonas collagenimarina]